MAECGPFDPEPAMAIGVSGGGDSLALLLLAHEWATLRGGAVIALSVDHRLRAGAADEMRHVREICAGQGIAHKILTWRHEGVASAIQARARRARYDLMSRWCREAGILHLMVAHTSEDQAETQAMRARRMSSGPGTAGMPSVRLEQGVRLLRPLLGQSGRDLRRYLQKLDIEWVEDPSNEDRRFERVRQRQDADITAPDFEGTIARGRLDQTVAKLASELVSLSPAGFAVVRREGLFETKKTSALLMAQLLRTVSGSVYMPSLEKATDLLNRLADSDAGGMTLGGCLLLPDKNSILITREYQRSATVTLGEALKDDWDGRFRIQVNDGFCGEKITIGPAGRCSVSLRPAVERTGLPMPVIRGLPAAFAGEELIGLVSCGDLFTGIIGISAQFRPTNPLVPSSRWLVPRGLPPILELANRP